jgi:hypothetical protein
MYIYYIHTVYITLSLDPNSPRAPENENSQSQTQKLDRPPGKGFVFSEEAESGTFRPPVASKQTKPILNFKNLKNGLNCFK